MILITGGSGFIGSSLLWGFNKAKIKDIVIVDDYGTGDKWKNIAKRNFVSAVHKDKLFPWIDEFHLNTPIKAVFHLGACSSTTEKDVNYLLENNFHYSCRLFDFCCSNNVPLIYASSAATYGKGDLGYSDDEEHIENLQPINPYGLSKHLFDRWILRQPKKPNFWVGLKFFNVFGPGEYHKGSMQSLVAKAVPQIQETSQLKLFKSYVDKIPHGEQKRDFIYIKDVVAVMMHFWHMIEKSSTEISGFYNVGTGKARSFAELGKATFRALNQEAKLEWIEMPPAIRNQYQYFTEADLDRLKNVAQYNTQFLSLEDSVKDYVVNYLTQADKYL